MQYEFTPISLLTLVGRNFRLNCILKQELRRYEPRSRFPKKSPFRPLFRAFYPHPASKSSLRVGRGSCGMPSLRRCPLANWPRISVGNWAPPPKGRKRKEPASFWHKGNVVGPFRLITASSPTSGSLATGHPLLATRHTPLIPHWPLFCRPS